jgi:phosphoglycolate phosphatase
MIILFDLDGTLIDSTEGILDGFYTSFDTFGTPKPSEEDITSLVGYPLEYMFENLGVEKSKVDEYVQAYKKRYRQISKQKTVFLPDAIESIKIASSFATLAVVTTKTGLYSKELLEHFGVLDYFQTVVGREDVTNPKPHEEPILTALSRINSDDKDIYMIGDTKLDLISAQNANVKSIGLTCGYGKEEELSQYTNIIKNSALQAVEYLEKMKNIE